MELRRYPKHAQGIVHIGLFESNAMESLLLLIPLERFFFTYSKGFICNWSAFW